MWDRVALSAQTHWLAQKATAQQLQALGFPEGNRRVVSHPKKLAQLSPSHCSHAEPLQEQHSGCLARRPALTSNSCVSDMPRREGTGEMGMVQRGDATQSKMRERDRELAFLVHFYDSLLLFQEVGERTRGRAAATNQG